MDTLAIGASALRAQQGALQVTGNNIANAATPGYTRQVAELQPYGTTNFGQGLRGGAGVALTDIRRVIDMTIESRINDAASQRMQYRVAETSLARVESLMNELTDTDLSSALNELFNAFSGLAQNAQDPALRGIVLQRAQTVVDRLRDLRNGLDDINQDLTGQLSAGVQEADRLAATIARLNTEIVSTESAQGINPSLRDQRDQAIRQLSALIEINVHETQTGAVSVYIGSVPLVDAGNSHGLSLERRIVGDRSELTVSFRDSGKPVNLAGGSLAGIQNTRDGELAAVIDRVDTLATELIRQVNRIHSSGTTIAPLTELRGTYRIEDASAALNSDAAGLDFKPVNGSFVVTTVRGDSRTTSQIEVNLSGTAGDTTAADLAAALNALPDVECAINPAGFFEIRTTDPNVKLEFGQDSSGVLGAMGINTFFDGNDARSIRLSDGVANNPDRVAAGRNGQTGDGSNAAALAALADQNLAELGGASLVQFHQRAVADVSVWTRGAADKASAADLVFEALTAQRESISGVSIDEEAINLMRYQRAFQGAARLISLVDELMATLLQAVS